MRRDVDRTELPPGSAYNLVDFIPDELQAAAVGRGGWTYAGPALTGAPSQIPCIGYHPDLGKVIATNGVSLWDAVAGGAALGTGHFGATAPPAYHRGYLFFGSTLFTGIPQAPGCLKDDGTLTSFASAPRGTIPGVYKDHALLARNNSLLGPSGAAQRNRLWFSAAGDPTTWDTTYGWWDTTGDIVALASLTNCILLFHGDNTERLRGDTPPPGSNMILEPFLPNIGCLDPFSVAYWQGNAIFASSSGVYLTNGVSVVDLTAAAGIKTYWQSLMAGYDTTWQLGAGVYRDHYILSLNSDSLVDCLCFSLSNRTAWRFTNIRGGSYVNVQKRQQEKLYAGLMNTGRVSELSSLWSPSATVKQDADGTTPTPIIETGDYRGWDRINRRYVESEGLQKWRFAYLDYDLRDAAADNPTITLSYATTPNPNVAYNSATGGSIPKTTDYSRVRRYLNATRGGATRSNMMAFKIAVNGPYAAARLYSLEAAFSPIDIGRLK